MSVKMWAVVNDKGVIQAHSVSTRRWQALFRFQEHSGLFDWPFWRREGYCCVRVDVSWEKTRAALEKKP